MAIDPIISKAANLGQTANQTTPLDRDPKTQPSKFDKVRERMAAEKPGEPDAANAGIRHEEQHEGDENRDCGSGVAAQRMRGQAGRKRIEPAGCPGNRSATA